MHRSQKINIYILPLNLAKVCTASVSELLHPNPLNSCRAPPALWVTLTSDPQRGGGNRPDNFPTGINKPPHNERKRTPFVWADARLHKRLFFHLLLSAKRAGIWPRRRQTQASGSITSFFEDSTFSSNVTNVAGVGISARSITNVSFFKKVLESTFFFFAIHKSTIRWHKDLGGPVAGVIFKRQTPLNHRHIDTCAGLSNR